MAFLEIPLKEQKGDNHGKTYRLRHPIFTTTEPAGD